MSSDFSWSFILICKGTRSPILVEGIDSLKYLTFGINLYVMGFSIHSSKPKRQNKDVVLGKEKILVSFYTIRLVTMFIRTLRSISRMTYMVQILIIMLVTFILRVKLHN